MYVCTMETHKDRGLVECKGGVHTSMTAERETNDGFKILTSHSLHLPLPPPPPPFRYFMHVHTYPHSPQCSSLEEGSLVGGQGEAVA